MFKKLFPPSVKLLSAYLIALLVLNYVGINFIAAYHFCFHI